MLITLTPTHFLTWHIESESESCSVESVSLRPHRLHSPRNSLGILEWVAFPLSRGSFQPRDRTQVSCIAGGFFTNRANMI